MQIGRGALPLFVDGECDESGPVLDGYFAGRNATHQMKKLTLDDLKVFRDSLRIPISDQELEANPYLPPYYHPGEDDETVQYVKDRRRRLGGDRPAQRA